MTWSLRRLFLLLLIMIVLFLANFSIPVKADDGGEGVNNKLSIDLSLAGKEGIYRNIIINIINKQSQGINLSKIPMIISITPPNIVILKKCTYKSHELGNCTRNNSYFIINNTEIREFIQINISIEINRGFENKYINVIVSLKNQSIAPLFKRQLKLSNTTFNLTPQVFLYYVKFNANVEGMEQLGAVKIGDGYLLLRQIFWPVLSSDTINISTCTINGVKYYCNSVILIPLCGIGTLAIIAMALPISLWVLTRRSTRERRVIEEVSVPEHIDLG
jgi:hypothetical protein